MIGDGGSDGAAADNQCLDLGFHDARLPGFMDCASISACKTPAQNSPDLSWRESDIR
jgi:hypothetical protein